ncbi:RHS repeat-associated core domain-containing protein [Pseudomonas koreensis]|uniref:Rhs n=1 Tax=Pseudomonas koreensis TaxID=198620 RepID=A0AA94JGQ0_9PSED|nr:RHS repeat-associated core domain-containing protein [Pseudomonas koreensis]RVD76169.1 Rhs [Pseudomonas koreensis]
MGIYSKTPSITVSDPRGLAILTVDYWRNDDSLPCETRTARTLRDAAGRAVKRWDARLWALHANDPQVPPSLASIYGLNDNPLRSDSNDAGMQLQLHGLGGEMLFGWDSRGTRRDAEYDELLRPVAVFEQGVGEPRRCVERLSYGREGDGDALRNQFGQLTRHDDPAGSVLFERFAITGECLASTRHFTRDPVDPDWPLALDERQLLLEPGEGAISHWRFAAMGQMLEQIDARGNRQGFELTIDGRLRAAHLQLKDQPYARPMVSEIRYNADGQVELEVAGNSVRTTLAYRPEDGRLMTRSAVSANEKLLQQLSYAYDPVGNVLSIEDQALPIRYFANQRIEPINHFIYDSLYQLSEASGWEAGAASRGPDSVGRVDPAAFANYRQTYRYDAGGNLLELTHVGAQARGRQINTALYSNRSLPWRNDVPPTEAQIAAAFDARGNLLELDQGRLVRWNRRNQLQSVSPVERDSQRNDEEIYRYDANGQRVNKVRALQTNARTVLAQTRYLPGLELRTDSGTGEILQVIIAQTGLNSVNVLHWETPPLTGRNDRFRYALTDHLGSASLELGEDARIISQETYYPFGETAWSREAEVSYRTVRYSGKERDFTGLYYYGHRYYIPWLQRWMNADPAGAVDGLNLYRMALNNPVSFMDEDGAVTRKKNVQGLWEPVLAVGAARDVPGAVAVDAGKRHEMVPFTFKSTDIRKALTPPEFSRLAINTDLFTSVTAKYSKNTSSQLVNTQGGDRFVFTMLRINYSGAAKGEFNAIKVVDIPAGDIPDQSSAVFGYWVAQGGYVDIPTHPKGTEPNYVFTPGFSGCSLTIDQLNDNTLRVRHVEGNKEDAQYNRLPAAEHGMGLSAAMEFMDYGFDSEGATVVTQLTTFAFVKYEPKTQSWDIHYQVNQGAASIGRFSTEKKLFGGSKSFANVMSNPKVRRTMSKQVATVSGRPKK